MSTFEKISVLGTGVLGSQIAFQAAYHGFAVTAYDISDEAVAAGEGRLDALVATYAGALDSGDRTKAEAARGRLTTTSDLALAAQADLIIEAAPEIIDVKRELYGRLGELAPEHTVFATNSSTLLPSDIKASTGRPDKFLALHFANHIFLFNTAEVMGSDETDPAVFQQVVVFAEAIGMVPIEVHKEKAGYVLNSLLVPLLDAAMELAAFDYATPEDVDKTWRIGTGSPAGPFQILDIVGLTTAYNISNAHPSEKSQKIAAWLKENYVDQGKLGVATGEGFYRYG
ncbi:MAG: 3-hydroxyacyl-CoA dehydrogenase [Solirubrobacteraceae bacterium]|nr:3-hydroxyacyl-CoA dehydrogenase [Patulibacter sp.]